MPKTKEEIAAYQKAYRERKKEELNAKAREKYVEKVGEAKTYRKRGERTKAEQKAEYRKEHKEELAEKAAVTREEKLGGLTKGRYKVKTDEEKVARETARVTKARVEKPKAMGRPRKEKTPEEMKTAYDARLAKQRERYKAKKEAEDAEAKARRDEADAEAQKVEAATRARILAKMKAESPREGGLSPDETIPEYAGPMEGLVPPEPPQPQMGLVEDVEFNELLGVYGRKRQQKAEARAKAEAPPPEAPPPPPPLPTREEKKAAKVADLERQMRDVASGRRDLTEGTKRFFAKQASDLKLPKDTFEKIKNEEAAKGRSMTYRPSYEMPRALMASGAGLLYRLGGY